MQQKLADKSEARGSSKIEATMQHTLMDKSSATDSSKNIEATMQHMTFTYKSDDISDIEAMQQMMTNSTIGQHKLTDTSVASDERSKTESPGDEVRGSSDFSCSLNRLD